MMKLLCVKFEFRHYFNSNISNISIKSSQECVKGLYSLLKRLGQFTIYNKYTTVLYCQILFPLV